VHRGGNEQTEHALTAPSPQRKSSSSTISAPSTHTRTGITAGRESAALSDTKARLPGQPERIIRPTNEESAENQRGYEGYDYAVVADEDDEEVRDECRDKDEQSLVATIGQSTTLQSIRELLQPNGASNKRVARLKVAQPPSGPEVWLGRKASTCLKLQQQGQVEAQTLARLMDFRARGHGTTLRFAPRYRCRRRSTPSKHSSATPKSKSADA
jgi:hypothetical protein